MGTITVSKNGEDFFDIPDTEEQQSGAEAKGYKRYIDVTKNGSDIFTIPADDNLEKAFAKGYKTVGEFNFTKDKSTATQITDTIGDTIKGISQGVTLGYGDEILGAVGAVFGEGSYQENRDGKRRDYKEARERSPVANTAGEIGGSLVTGLAAPGVGSTLKGSIGFGAGQGLGNSEADLTEGDVLGAARDTALGAGAGALGYGVGKGIEKAAPYVVDGVKAVPKYATAAGRGFKEGFKETQESIPGSIGTALGTANGGLRAIKEMINSRSTIKEVGALATAARQVLKIKRIQDIDVKPQLEAFGSGKSLSNLADDEAITLAAMIDGDNPVKEYIAKTMGMSGSSANVQKYQKLLSEPSANRLLSRDLDTYNSAKELVQPFKEAKNLMTDSRNARYNQLQDAARNAFDGKADEVFSGIQAAKSDAASLKSIPGSVRNLIEDVEGLVSSGKGTRAQKLVEGAWDEAPNAEKFNRLQRARELVDSKLDWATAQGESQAESVLRTLREDIDGILKLDKSKLEADALYKASKELEADFFRGTEFRGPDGKFEVDAAKIKRMLGDSDAAKRFRENKEQLEKFSGTPGLSDDFKIEANTLLLKLDKALEQADLQRGLYGIQRADGPSAGAIARLQSSLGKSGGFIKEGIENPSGFMSGIDNFKQDLLSRTGKSLEQMNPSEQLNAVKVNIWLKNNKDAPMEQKEKIWKKFGF